MIHYRRMAARFISLLMRGQYSIRDMAEKTPMDYERARALMHDLKAEGVVYISAWRRDSMNRVSIALYSLGIGVDAVKPRARTGVERTRKYNNRFKEPLKPVPKKVKSPKSVFDLGANQ